MIFLIAVLFLLRKPNEKYAIWSNPIRCIRLFLQLKWLMMLIWRERIIWRCEVEISFEPHPIIIKVKNIITIQEYKSKRTHQFSPRCSRKNEYVYTKGQHSNVMKSSLKNCQKCPNLIYLPVRLPSLADAISVGRYFLHPFFVNHFRLICVGRD